MADLLPHAFQKRYVIIGNPENRRIQFFQQALKQFSQPQAEIISYIDLLQDPHRLSDALTPDTILRIESPGENFEVEKQLLSLGETEAESEGVPFLSTKKIQRLSFDRGLILHPRQWYLGYRYLMQEVGQQLSEANDVFSMSQPADIIEFFDKRLCHARCFSAGCPVPDSLNPIHSFDELVEKMAQKNDQRVFLKLAHSSSASGVIAFFHNENRTEAITSAELVRTSGGVKIYNSLKIQRYTDLEDIRDLIDELCLEQIHVEKWLPKASLKHGTTFDLRVVVIDGQARHFVVRESRSPLSNLHLGNRRGDGKQLIDALGTSGWENVRKTCEQAASLYPGSFQIGVDILLTPGFRQRAILELNAFGDLLPGILHQEWNTYQFEVKSLLNHKP